MTPTSSRLAARTTPGPGTKSHVFLIELTIAILVFALAAAIVLGLFVKADQTSRRSQLTTIAIAVSQSMAEQLKAAESPAQAHQALVIETGLTGSSKSRPALDTILYFDQRGTLVQDPSEAAFQIQAHLVQEERVAGTLVSMTVLAEITDASQQVPLVSFTVKKYFSGEEAAR